MIIDLKKSKEKYFLMPSAKEILESFKGNLGTIECLQDLSKSNNIIVCTDENNLEKLLKNEYSLNHIKTCESINDSDSSTIIVLPPEYRINKKDANFFHNYTNNSLLLLDSIKSKKEYMINPKKGIISKKAKQNNLLSPEKVISSAFNSLSKDSKNIKKNLLSYSWWGLDRHRRIVSLYRSIQGAELRSFNIIAEFTINLPKLAYKYNNLVMNNNIPENNTKKLSTFINYYRNYLIKGNYLENINQFNVSTNNLIKIKGKFAKGSGSYINVPSRKLNNLYYNLKITGIPQLDKKDILNYSQWWEIRGNCNCKNKMYMGDRRKTKPNIGNDEYFFCAHEIAAFHTLRKKDKTNDKGINLLPFLIPTKETIDFLDRLRYQTVMLEYNENKDKWSLRTLNNTEMENILFKRTILKGYEQSFSSDINLFKEKGYDPTFDLIKFKKN
jgi:hypothetical protein